MADPLDFYRKAAVQMLTMKPRPYTIQEAIEHFNKEVGIQLGNCEKLVHEAASIVANSKATAAQNAQAIAEKNEAALINAANREAEAGVTEDDEDLEDESIADDETRDDLDPVDDGPTGIVVN